MRKWIILAALALGGCETTPTINSDFDPSVNFSKYRTYSWVYQAPPQGMNPLIYERIRASIDRSLMARGYTQASPGDFAVAFTVGRRDRAFAWSERRIDAAKSVRGETESENARGRQVHLAVFGSDGGHRFPLRNRSGAFW